MHAITRDKWNEIHLLLVCDAAVNLQSKKARARNLHLHYFRRSRETSVGGLLD